MGRRRVLEEVYKAGGWKKDTDEEALKYWNLVRIVDAKLFGKDEPHQLTMEELVREDATYVLATYLSLLAC
jgi:hypothetical protein